MMTLLVTAMTLGELLGAAAGQYAGMSVSDLTLDSRSVRKGAAFVAVQGARSHGLRHAEEALRRGAAIVLYEPQAGLAAPSPSLALPGLGRELGTLARRFYGRARSQPSLFGVTGTNGKTTVAWLVAQAMAQRTASCGYIGTLGHGQPPELESQELTTPDCLALHRLVYGLGVDHVALEVSSHALAQARVAGLEFHTAALTNLTRDHLDQHADMAAYGAAKRRLFDAPGLTHAVLNLDDAFAAALLPEVSGRLRTCGVSLTEHPAARLHGRLLESSLSGVELELTDAEHRGRIHAPLLGAFNAENLLVALGALLAWDVPLGEACEALSHCAAAPGRMELVAPAAATRAEIRPRIVVDYAHTPDALERALRALRPLTAHELWCVFGCGGERDTGKRPLMGAVAERLADHVVITDDNPRGEDPVEIVAAIRQGFATPARARIEHNRARAIEFTVRAADPEDVVLIAGKGHESVQIGPGGSRPFSDREAAQAALEARV